jgi:BirA family biotin operon repressor/biotin-[acetyl-CoA-carboxylase] ligase
MNIDAQLLRKLRGSDGRYLSAKELAQALGITRPALSSRIEELRSLGYEITASPHEGYHLVHGPDVLHADDLVSRLGNMHVIGRDVRVFRETTSTSDVAEKLARDHVKEGVTVFAEAQTKGRGRLGRKWLSPSGKGLWFSVLLRPDVSPQAATRLTILAGTALRRAIAQHTGLNAEIKWPNDTLLNGRKVAGILTELSGEVDKTRYVILGIGVDVNLNAGDFTPEVRRIATSIKLELGQAFDRAELAAVILTELDHDYGRMVSGGFAEIADEWEDHCRTIGREVSVTVGERRIRGRAEALSPDGALLIRTEHGHLESVTGGDVTLEE